MMLLKKFFAALLALAMTLTLSAALAEDNSLQAILDKGTFIIGLDDSFPPMGYRDENNDIVGFDIDVARAVAEKLGVEFIAQPISWEAKDPGAFLRQHRLHLERHVHHPRAGGKHGHDLPLPEQPDRLLHQE